MKINQWFSGKVISQDAASCREQREALFSHIDREKAPLHEYPSLCGFPIYIWCVDKVWYWSDEDLDGNIYIFPKYLDGVSIHVIETLLRTMEEAYRSGLEEGKRRKVCQFNRLMGEFKDVHRE